MRMSPASSLARSVVALIVGLGLSYRVGAEGPLTMLDSPAGLSSRYSSWLVTESGDRYLSWIERAADDSGDWRVLVAVRTDENWKTPVEVARGDDLFVNWADFPAIGASRDGELLVAHYLQKVDSAPYAYHIMFCRSMDHGTTWSAPERLHDDSTPTEHGFVSYAPEGDDRIRAFWLDGRAMEGSGGHGHDAGHGAMSLRTAVIASDAISSRELIDDRVCECCGTAAAAPLGRPLVVYRDRIDDEVRDVSFARAIDRAPWRLTAPIARDGWRIPGCPVNGPAVDATGEVVAVAWFTEADQSPRVQFAWSFDGGSSFESPVVVDQFDADGVPIGRVDVEIGPATGDALVLWLDHDRSAAVTDEYETQVAALRARRITRDGEMRPTIALATTRGGRASGFPRAARFQERLLLTWTEVDADHETRIRVAEIPISKIP